MAYKGTLQRSVEGKLLESTVIIKELYPKDLGIKRKSRTDAELVIPVESIDEYNAFRESFGKRFIRFSEYASVGHHSMPDFFSTEALTIQCMLFPVR